MARLAIDATTGGTYFYTNILKMWLPWIPSSVTQGYGMKLFDSDSITQIGPVSGTAGRDLMFFGTWQTLQINSGAGDDTILMTDGEVAAHWGAPSKPFPTPRSINAGAGNDHVAPSEYNDVVDGGTGFDIVLYWWSIGAARVNLGTGAASGGSAQFDKLINFEGIYGSRFDDHIIGSAAANDLRGSSGNDSVFGQDGNDTMYGEAGNDYLQGNVGDDLLWGALGVDSLYGGAGTDRLLGRGDGDLLDGGAGVDTATYHVATGAVTANLANGQARVAGVTGTDGLVAIERLTGSNFADRLTGSNLAEFLDGAVGNDEIAGSGGNDTVQGGTGSDTLYGGIGDDLLNGGAGADSLHGGLGADHFIFANQSAAGRDVIRDFADNQDSLTLSGFGVSSFAALQSRASVIDGDDLLLSFGNQSLVIANFSLAKLSDDIILA